MLQRQAQLSWSLKRAAVARAKGLMTRLREILRGEAAANATSTLSWPLTTATAPLRVSRAVLFQADKGNTQSTKPLGCAFVRAVNGIPRK